MALYRCTNDDCSEADAGPPEFHFEAERPAKPGECPPCPKCKEAGCVVGLVTVHYLVNDPAGPIRTPHGGRAIACQPEARRLDGKYQCAGVRPAVNCPACRATAVFQHERDDVDQHKNILKKGTPI